MEYYDRDEKRLALAHDRPDDEDRRTPHTDRIKRDHLHDIQESSDSPS